MATQMATGGSGGVDLSALSPYQNASLGVITGLWLMKFGKLLTKVFEFSFVVFNVYCCRNDVQAVQLSASKYQKHCPTGFTCPFQNSFEMLAHMYWVLKR